MIFLDFKQEINLFGQTILRFPAKGVSNGGHYVIMVQIIFREFTCSVQPHYTIFSYSICLYCVFNRPFELINSSSVCSTFPGLDRQ